MGIAESEPPYLFERFHRVRNARGRSFEATGIGLALVAELAKLQGGTVDVESTVGMGSTFSVSLPLGADHLPKERTGANQARATAREAAGAYLEEALQWFPAEAETGTQCEAREESEGRVLLADGYTDMREYLRRMLSESYEVEAVSNGAEALKAAHRGSGQSSPLPPSDERLFVTMIALDLPPVTVCWQQNRQFQVWIGADQEGGLAVQ